MRFIQGIIKLPGTSLFFLQKRRLYTKILYSRMQKIMRIFKFDHMALENYHTDEISKKYIINKYSLKSLPKNLNLPIQKNLCQKLLFLHQLTHNIMTDCSFFMKIVSSEYLQNMQLLFLFCFHIHNNFGTQHVLQMLRASEKDLPVLYTEPDFRVFGFVKLSPCINCVLFLLWFTNILITVTVFFKFFRNHKKKPGL